MWPKLVLVLILILTFLSRTVGQWSEVFVGGDVLFRGTDPWYHMRLGLVLLNNFPSYLHNDFFGNPMGLPPVGYPPLLTFIIAVPGFLFGLAESQLEVYAALLPPIFAALVVLVMYFLALEALKDKTFALVAALLMGILPTEFFHRSLLGFTDHHFLEVLLTELSLLFLLKLSNSNNYKWGLPLGLSLGLFYLSWNGVSYIASILIVFAILNLYWLYVKDRDTSNFAFGFGGANIIAFLMFLPYSKYSIALTPHMMSLALGIAIPTLFFATSQLVKDKWLYVSGTLTIGSLAVITAFQNFPIITYLGSAFSYGSRSIVSETNPLSLTQAFAAFGLPLIMSIMGLAIYLKERNNLLILVFAIPILLSTLGQVRYGYYLVIPIVLFTSYLFMYIVRQVKPNLRAAVTIILLMFTVMASISNIVRLATFENNITPGMYEALVWMRGNTPDPYWYNPKAFYSNNLNKNADYQILGWWDYGAWIMYIARREALTSPLGWGLPQLSNFFVAQTTDEAEASLPKVEKLYGEGNLNIRYIFVDRYSLTSKFYAIARIAGYGDDEFKELRENSMLMRLWLDKVPGYKMVYANDEVRIFEVLK